jgi:hypothetical protein
MIESGSLIYLRCDTRDEDSPMFPGRAREVDELSAVIELVDRMLLKAGEACSLFAHAPQGPGFIRQPSTTQAMLSYTPHTVVRCRLDGDPKPADQRETFRLCVAAKRVNVRVGKLEGCEVTDISIGGLAVITPKALERGDTLLVELALEGRSHTGEAMVRSCVEVSPGRYRCGLSCGNGAKASGELRRGMQSLFMTAQRDQLRRRAGG